MKNFFYGIILIFALALAYHFFKAEPPAPVIVAAPTPTPAPTPNPAKGAIRAAIQMYPDLGKKDSTFNMMFVDMVNQRKTSDPESLTRADWPLAVADEVGRRLGIQALPISSPTPSATPRTIVVVQSPTPDSILKFDDPLSKGAYGGTKNPVVIRVMPTPYH